MSEPLQKYRFYEAPLGQPGDDRPMVYGDARYYPGNYTIGRELIVKLYNTSTHGRSRPELKRMGEINEAFHTGKLERMRVLIEDTRNTFRKRAHPSVQKMWDGVFAAYEKAAKAKR